MIQYVNNKSVFLIILIKTEMRISMNNKQFCLLHQFLNKAVSLLIVFIIVITLSGCSLPWNQKQISETTISATEDNADFTEYVNNLFADLLSADMVSLHAYVEQPRDFGINNYEITLGRYDLDNPDDSSDYTDIISTLKSFDRSTLSAKQQITLDELGQKIELKAEEAGITPKEFVDNVSTEIKRIWDLMNTSYDKFIRTTDDYHEKQVQKIFKKLYDQGDIYKGSYEGMYCTPCESFWTESQLVDGKCPDCGREVKPAKEEAYFFKMSKYANKLIEHINTHPEFIQPVSRKNEMMNNFLLPGLQDLCVSRTSFKWGIPVDFDDKHVVYVWLDALTNYITGIGYDADGNSSEQYKKFWPADLHLIGKDIIRFHTIYWPIFLMALGEPLPKQVFGHPWLLQNDGKMSKSKGNVIYADDLVDLFGVDAVRYFVAVTTALRSPSIAASSTPVLLTTPPKYLLDIAIVLFTRLPSVLARSEFIRSTISSHEITPSFSNGIS
jgi:hypothetical protein